jgi:hypothetical protein
MRINTGSMVTWSSAQGQLAGEVVGIRLDLNAANEIVPWLVIKRWDSGTTVCLCGTDSYIKSMKLKVFEKEFA